MNISFLLITALSLTRTHLNPFLTSSAAETKDYTLPDAIFNITFPVRAIIVVAVFPMNKSSLYSAGVYVAKTSFTEQICLVEPESRNHSLGFPTKLHSDIIAHSHLHLPSFPRCLLDFCLCLCLCPFLEHDNQKTYEQPCHKTVAFEFLLGLF